MSVVSSASGRKICFRCESEAEKPFKSCCDEAKLVREFTLGNFLHKTRIFFASARNANFS